MRRLWPTGGAVAQEEEEEEEEDEEEEEEETRQNMNKQVIKPITSENQTVHNKNSH
jgi:hypothetical protein